jgi:hypothetical protein
MFWFYPIFGQNQGLHKKGVEFTEFLCKAGPVPGTWSEGAGCGFDQVAGKGACEPGGRPARAYRSARRGSLAPVPLARPGHSGQAPDLKAGRGSIQPGPGTGSHNLRLFNHRFGFWFSWGRLARRRSGWPGGTLAACSRWEFLLAGAPAPIRSVIPRSPAHGRGGQADRRKDGIADASNAGTCRSWCFRYASGTHGWPVC